MGGTDRVIMNFLFYPKTDEIIVWLRWVSRRSVISIRDRPEFRDVHLVDGIGWEAEER